MCDNELIREKPQAYCCFISTLNKEMRGPVALPSCHRVVILLTLALYCASCGTTAGNTICCCCCCTGLVSQMRMISVCFIFDSLIEELHVFIGMKLMVRIRRPAALAQMGRTVLADSEDFNWSHTENSPAPPLSAAQELKMLTQVLCLKINIYVCVLKFMH